MRAVFEFFELAASFIELYVLYLTYNDILRQYRRAPNHRYDIALALAGAGIAKFCNSIAMFSYYTIIVGLLYASITAFFLYRTKYMMLFSIGAFYLLCLGCVDAVIITAVYNLWPNNNSFLEFVTTIGVPRTFMLIASKGAWLIAYSFLKKFFYRISLKIDQTYTVLAISCAGFIGFVFLTNQTVAAFHSSLTGVWLLVVILLALLFFIGYLVVVRKEEKMKLDFSEVRNQLLEENYQSINRIYAGNSKLYHDLNNHLNVLYQMLDSGNADDARQYIEEISKPVKKLSNTIWTGENVVDVIINSKTGQMKELGIRYHINVEFPKNMDIQPHDICTILANLLDNAIEAAGKLEDPGEISLTIRRIHHFLMIQVSNSCDAATKDFVHFPETTKPDRKLHGWGLPSVMEAVEKYHGTLKCIREGNTFIVRILLF